MYQNLVVRQSDAIDYEPAIKPNIEEAERFLDLLGNGEEFTFQTFDDGDNKSPTLARVFHGTLEQHAKSLIDLNKQGAGVFVMVNRGDGVIHEGSKTCRTTSNVTSVRSIFIDLDDGASEKLDAVMASAVKPSIVVESSTDKYHCYWLVKECQMDMFTQIQAAFLNKYLSDPKVKDLPRVMRLAGFYHQKGKPVMTIIRDDLSSKVSGLDLNELMVSNAISSNASVKPGKPKLSVVGTVINEGQRNNTLTSVAGSLLKKKYSEQEIISHLLDINQSRCVPPLPEIEVHSIVKSVVSRYSPRVDSDELSKSLTDTGNAERFANRYSKTVKYVPDWGSFIIFDGHYWKVDNVNKVMEFAKQVTRDIYLEGSAVEDLKLRNDLAKHSSKSQQLPRLNAMIELTKSIEAMIIPSSELNADDMLLCVKNGVIDFRTGEFRAGRIEDYITQSAPVNYDPDARCPRFIQFLGETFVGDTSESMLDQVTGSERNEVIDYMQKTLGYCLTGRTGEQCLFFAHGTGANGKTTLINVMLSLLGQDYSLQTPMDTLMVKSGGNSSSNHLARLQNIRFVAATEIEDGSKMSESLIKQMTGGDRIAARFLYKEFVEFTPKFKLFIAGNHKPRIKGTDEGIWRRIHLVPFEITIAADKRDSALPEKLRAELSGILNWLIEGCIKWQQERLTIPMVMQCAIQEYREEMDTLGLWIKEGCIVGDGYKMKAQDAFKSYQRWAVENGFYALCSENFYGKLGERYKKTRSSKGNLYLGIKLQMTM
jgi:putative DNA primase/helicase